VKTGRVLIEGAIKMDAAQLEKDVSEIAGDWKNKEGNLIMILHRIQSKYGYVPRQVSLELSKHLDIPLARIYEVITFYNYFKLEPPGKYTISVCMGTACYLKGAPILLNELERVLGITEGQTTKDGMFRVEVVRCLGCCGLAPVLTVGGKIYQGVKKNEIGEIISKYAAEENGGNGGHKEKP